jgi:hypothetical protein
MLDKIQKKQLHEIALHSIEYGLNNNRPLKIQASDYDKDLQIKRATFVTLHKNEQLRGCIGILEPLRPLVADIAHNAFAAAFSDSRFPPVSPDELSQLKIHISILGTPEEILFDSENDLLSQLQPGIDGLILQEGSLKGTFLPSVWESLPEKHDFLNHLKAKTGLPANYWSDNIKVQRYTVEDF